MSHRRIRITPLALALLAAVSTSSCAASGAPVPARGEKAPDVAAEVVVLTKVDARGNVRVFPDPAVLRTGQRLVIGVCCEELSVRWKKPVQGIPEPRCEAGECVLVAPAVEKRTEVEYSVSGSCNGKRFEVDPRFIFIR
jgi:hypothetical protein